MSTPIRLLVADDHPIVREGLIAVLSTQPDFGVVGAAGTGREAVRQVIALHPDVVLLDLAMPELDGVAAIGQMRAAWAEVRVLVFTAFDTDERIFDAVRAGAQGYLLKGVPREEIFQAIRVVHSGASLLQPLIASRLLRQVREEAALPPASILTTREGVVLGLLARGLQNKEIAAELGISERTVKFHVGGLLKKLDAGNRTEAVTRGVQQGLVTLPNER
jgi:DNA-binding NarL/FixJ family response regulator